MKIKQLIRKYNRWNKLVYVSNILLVGCTEAALEIWDLREKAPWLAEVIIVSMGFVVLTFVCQMLVEKWDFEEDRADWEKERQRRSERKQKNEQG